MMSMAKLADLAMELPLPDQTQREHWTVGEYEFVQRGFIAFPDDWCLSLPYEGDWYVEMTPGLVEIFFEHDKRAPKNDDITDRYRLEGLHGHLL
jgi:hypothetical protein